MVQCDYWSQASESVVQVGIWVCVGRKGVRGAQKWSPACVSGKEFPGSLITTIYLLLATPSLKGDWGI